MYNDIGKCILMKYFIDEAVRDHELKYFLFLVFRWYELFQLGYVYQ